VEGDVDLCVDHPGGEVDINFVTDLRTMTEVWLGDLSLREARSSKRLMITGPTGILRNLSSWLPLSAFSGIGAGKTEPPAMG
jgi:hypothetical protein